MYKPKVFIGSSQEALSIARALESNLAKDCQTYLWPYGTFNLSRSTIEDLEDRVQKTDYAVLVLAPDDQIKSRGEDFFSPRDNVLFELGLFVGKIGREKTFIVCDNNNVKIPSDWDGISKADFDWNRAIKPGEAQPALSPASTQIIEAMRRTPTLETNSSLSDKYADEVPGEDEFYQIVVGRSPSRNGIVISHNETTWAWKLFPTILEWRCRGIPITAYITTAYGGEKKRRQEIYRRNLLSNLGVNVIEMDNMKSNGVYLDVYDDENLDVLIIWEDTTGYGPFARRYQGNQHREAAIALLDSLPEDWKNPNDEYIPEIKKCEYKEVVELLKGHVSQYKGTGISITPETLDTSDLLMISRYTRAYKYNQIKHLEGRYKKLDITPFESMKVILKDGSFSIQTPPIVEKRDEGFVVIEGNTRATYLFNNKLSAFNCLLVEGVTDPLPSIPYPISEVHITEQTLSPKQRMEKFEYDLFRHIERAVHPY